MMHIWTCSCWLIICFHLLCGFDQTVWSYSLPLFSNTARLSSCTFTHPPLRCSSMNHATLSSNLPYLHHTVYPNDDYKHMKYIPDINTVSPLKTACQQVIAEVTRNKRPIDALGCGIDRNFYTSEDDLREEIIEFDVEYGNVMNISSITKANVFRVPSSEMKEVKLLLEKISSASSSVSGSNAIADLVVIPTDKYYFHGMSLRKAKEIGIMIRNQASTKENAIINRAIVIHQNLIIDKYQILESRAAGSDSILLYPSILGKKQLIDLIAYARNVCSLESIVVVQSKDELDLAVEAGAKVVLLSRRNLHDLKNSIDVSLLRSQLFGMFKSEILEISNNLFVLGGKV